MRTRCVQKPPSFAAASSVRRPSVRPTVDGHPYPPKISLSTASNASDQTSPFEPETSPVRSPSPPLPARVDEVGRASCTLIGPAGSSASPATPGGDPLSTGPDPLSNPRRIPFRKETRPGSNPVDEARGIDGNHTRRDERRSTWRRVRTNTWTWNAMQLANGARAMQGKRLVQTPRMRSAGRGGVAARAAANRPVWCVEGLRRRPTNTWKADAKCETDVEADRGDVATQAAWSHAASPSQRHHRRRPWV